MQSLKLTILLAPGRFSFRSRLTFFFRTICLLFLMVSGTASGAALLNGHTLILARGGLAMDSDYLRLQQRLIQGETIPLIIEYRQPADTSIRRNSINPLVDTPFRAIKQAVDSHLSPDFLSKHQDYSHLPMALFKVNGSQGLDQLLQHTGIKAVYEDRQERLLLNQSLPLIQQPEAALLGYTGLGSSVAILDTGVDYTLSSFGSCTAPATPANCRVRYAQDFAPDDGVLDDNSHGTNVGGIVASVAPQAGIIALDVFRQTSSGLLAYSSDVIAAINWSISNQAIYNITALNLSLGSGRYYSPCSSDPYATPIAQARSAGILVAVASGNDNYKDSLSSPACVADAVSVGAVYDSNLGGISWGSGCSDATTYADLVTCFSNSASFLDLIAPGAMITAAGITMAGTSQATPHVAGAAAVLSQAFPGESVDQRLAHLSNTGTLVTDSNGIAKPRIDLYAAVNDTTTTPTPTDTNLLADPSLEGGTPNLYWNDYSSNFGTVLCTVSSCSDGGTGAHLGTWWAWFGGITGINEDGYLEQVLTIPSSPSAILSFYLAVPNANTTGSLSVLMDGTTLFTVTEADAINYPNYQQVTLDISAYADGNPHTLRINSHTDAGADSLNFMLDDFDIHTNDSSNCSGTTVTITTDFSSGNHLCEGSISITTSGPVTIGAGADVEFRSGVIQLNPPFTVQPGATFRAGP